MNFKSIQSTIYSRGLTTRTECVNGNLSVTGYDRDMNRIVVVNRHKIQVKGKIYAADVNLDKALDHYKTRGMR
jgi:hypothetical protein